LCGSREELCPEIARAVAQNKTPVFFNIFNKVFKFALKSIQKLRKSSNIEVNTTAWGGGGGGGDRKKANEVCTPERDRDRERER